MTDYLITATDNGDVSTLAAGAAAVTIAVTVPSTTGGGGGGAVDSVNGKTGVVVLTAADVGAGTSSLALGTTSTTAKAGNYQPTAANISDSTTVGRAVVTAVDGPAARTAIGAGTSSLAIGTTSSTAKAGDYQPASTNITDATTVGKAVLTGVDAAAVRSAIGAGTSSLAIGVTGTTAAAGNDSRLSDARTPTAHAASHAAAGSDPLTLAESQVTGLVTDLAAKVPTTRAVAGHALSADVTLVKADVGLGNVDNTADTAKTFTESQVTNLVADLAAKQPLDSDLTTIAGLTATTDNFLQSKSSAWASRTPTQVAADLALPIAAQGRTINAQTGTSYTTVLTDGGKFVTMTNAAASTLTVPPNSSVAYPVGTLIEGAQLGAGQVTLAPGAGVTINGTPGLKVAATYGTFALLKTATDTWLAMGRLSA